MPIGSWLGAEACFVWLGMLVQIIEDHLVGDISAGSKEGKYVFYRLADPVVLSLFGSLRQVAERGLGEVDRIVRSYFEERDAMEAVSREELMDRARDGLVTVLDVRPADEYAAGHVRGALNIPLDELELRLSELNPDQEIVAY